MERSKMSIEREKSYVSELFDTFENEGFAKRFWGNEINTVDYTKVHGKPFKVVRRATDKDTDLSNLPMWLIQFEKWF